MSSLGGDSFSDPLPKATATRYNGSKTLGDSFHEHLVAFRDENNLTATMTDDIATAMLKKPKWKAVMRDEQSEQTKNIVNTMMQDLGPSGYDDLYDYLHGYIELCRRKAPRRLRFCLWIMRKVIR